MLDQVLQGLVRVTEMVRQDTVDALKTGDHIEVIKHFARVREATEKTKVAREAISEISDRLSKEQIPDLVRDLREKTGVKPPFKIEGVGSVSVAYKWSATILEHGELGKQPGYDWLRNNGAESLITETVNAQTLASHARDMLENHGEEMPPELFKVGQNAYTSIRK
jgi:hypothetical protein